MDDDDDGGKKSVDWIEGCQNFHLFFFSGSAELTSLGFGVECGLTRTGLQLQYTRSGGVGSRDFDRQQRARETNECVFILHSSSRCGFGPYKFAFTHLIPELSPATCCE